MRCFVRYLALLTLTATMQGAEPASQPAKPSSVASWDDVKARVLEQFRKHKFVSGRVETHVFRRVAGGQSETQGSGIFQMKIGPEKTLVRLEMTDNTLRTTSKGIKQETLSRLSVSDGDVVQTLVELEPQRWNAYRGRHQGVDTFDVVEIIGNLDAEHSVRMFEDATVDGTAVFVLDATPRLFNEKIEIQRRRYYFAKNSGLLVKREGFNAAGELRDTFRIADIKIDEPVPDSQFVFQPPQGVQVMDLTAQQDALASRPAQP